MEAPGGTTRPARGFDLNSSALSQLEARLSETSGAPAANPAQPQPEAVEAPAAPDSDLPVRAREAIEETADVLVGAGADFRDLVLEQRVRRMCPPVDLVLVTPAGGDGRLALVSMDAARLAAWARDAEAERTIEVLIRRLTETSGVA